MTPPDSLPMGLGTSNVPVDRCADVVEWALDIGYRHVDTAQYYDTEAAVGRGLARSDVDRGDVVVATKVRPGNLGYEDVLRSVEESLDRLDVDAVDVLYVHGPAGAYDPEATIDAFEELHDRGAFTRFGVSNFSPAQVREASERATMTVFANQVEMHPLYQQDDLHAFARETGLQLVAYSPLARGAVFEVDVLQEVAAAHDASVAQVSLAWLSSKENVVPIPKASSRDHLADNFRARDLELSATEIERIDAIDRVEKVIEPFGDNPT
ncbi:MAG: aldo/keto reductase [Halorhabdus sp.]